MKQLIHLLLISLFLSIAHAEKRVALVIGCETYSAANSLKNPKNDATLLTTKLTQLKFDSVISVTEVSAKAFNRKLEEFREVAFQADVAVFYFAGHGMEVGEVNYLLPTDAVLEEAADLKQEAISLPDILKLLSDAQVKAKVVILDCCRNNPFANTQKERAWMRTRAFTASGHEQTGLADVKGELAQGTVILFAAEPGKKAKDGPDGGNSPFATALVSSMGLAKKDGSGPLDVYHTMTNTATAVKNVTGGTQKPWLKFDGQPQLLEELAFATVTIGTQAPSPAPVAKSTPVPVPTPINDPIPTPAAPERLELPKSGYFPLGSLYLSGPYENYNDYSKGQILKEAQQKLKTAGHYASTADGTPGPGTQRAILSYQEAHGIPLTGKLDATTIASLNLAGIAQLTPPVVTRPKNIDTERKPRIKAKSEPEPAAATRPKPTPVPAPTKGGVRDISVEEFMRRAKTLEGP